MNDCDISWKAPWRAIQFAAEIPGVLSQFEEEIYPQHPLYDKGGVVIGRRIDNDDILVRLNDGSFVNVHLVWSKGPGVFPGTYPLWFSYGSLELFVFAMNEDAAEYEE